MEKSTSKVIFDDYSDVKECTDCQHWWLNQCDGVSTDRTRPCNSFLATRRVKLPEEVKRLRTLVYWLSACNVLYGILAAVLLVMQWKGML